MNSIFSIKLLLLSAVLQMSFVFAGLALTRQFEATLAPRTPEAIAAARAASDSTISAAHAASADTAAVQAAGAVSAGSKSNTRLIKLVDKSVASAQAGKTLPLSAEEKAAARAMLEKFNRLSLEEKMHVFRDQSKSFAIGGGVIGGVGGAVGGGVVGGLIGNSVGKKSAEKKHDHVDGLQKQSAVAPLPVQAA